MIYTAIQRRASDIHVETQDDAVHVKYRIDGVLQADPEAPVDIVDGLASEGHEVLGLPGADAHLDASCQREGVGGHAQTGMLVPGEGRRLPDAHREMGLLDTHHKAMVQKVLYHGKLKFPSLRPSDPQPPRVP